MTEPAPAVATPTAEGTPPAATPPAPAAPLAQQPAAPEWLGGLSEELRGDATLARYNSVEDLARGHIEAHKLAKSKAVPLPGDSDESRKAFADALRPQAIDAYDFGEVPATVDKGLVDGWREFAFAEGLPPHWAKGALDFYTGAMAKQVDAANQASQADVEAFKKDYGSGYDAKVAQVQQMLEGFTGTPLELGEEDLQRFDMKLGSSTLLKAMFAIHDRFGDPAPAGAGAVQPGLTRIAPENADATFKAKMADANWRKQAKIAGTAEHREAENLQKLIAQHRIAQSKGG